MIECKLKELMKSHNVNQTQLSKAIGISRPTILTLVRNEAASIRLDTLDKMLKYFNVSIDEFLISDEEVEKDINQKLDEIINIAGSLKNNGGHENEKN